MANQELTQRPRLAWYRTTLLLLPSEEKSPSFLATVHTSTPAALDWQLSVSAASRHGREAKETE